MTDNIRFGQTIFDFCVWKYGTLQQISRLVLDNDLKYDANVVQGQELAYNEDFGNEDIKDYLNINGFIPINDLASRLPLEFGFIFEDGNNFIFEDENDYFFEDETVGPIIPIPELNYWPFLGNTDDIVGGNDGINFGAVLVNDKAGNPLSAYDFERSEDDYMSLTSEANLGKLHSIAFRINLENVASNILLSKTTATNWVKFTSDTLVIYQNGGGNQAAFTVPSISALNYYDLVMTRNGTEVKLYIDAVQVGGTQVLPSDNDFILDALTSPTIQKLDGILDVIRIYNRVITQDEIDLIHAEV